MDDAGGFVFEDMESRLEIRIHNAHVLWPLMALGLKILLMGITSSLRIKTEILSMSDEDNEVKDTEQLLQLITEYRKWSRKIWPFINYRRGVLLNQCFTPGYKMNDEERKELGMLQEYADFYLDRLLPELDDMPEQPEEDPKPEGKTVYPMKYPMYPMKYPMDDCELETPFELDAPEYLDVQEDLPDASNDRTLDPNSNIKSHTFVGISNRRGTRNRKTWAAASKHKIKRGD
jgi:hypothetical protein